jgi:flagellar hook-associated protein 1 FlgK
MGSIQSIMNRGVNALSVQRNLMGVISNNITNAGTPGYSKQNLGIEAAAWGIGAQVTSHTSLRDVALERSILGAAQSFGFEDSRSSVLQLAEAAVNNLGGAGPGQALEDFFAALKVAAANPGGTSERDSVLNHAKQLARSISEAATGIEDARSTAARSASETTSTINAVAKDIAELNGQIRIVGSTGEPVHELVDQRDELLRKIGQLVDIDVVEQDGSVAVSLAGGQPLVDGIHTNELHLAGGNREPITIWMDKGDGQKLTGITEVGGRLGGIISARDETMLSALDRLDATAFGLITAMNDIHKGAFALDGTSGRALFAEPVSATGAAITMSISLDVEGEPENLAFAADPTLIPGDNFALKQLAAVREALVGPEHTTPAGGLDLVVNTVARALNEANSRAETHSTHLAEVNILRSSRTGVSVQEEMVALTESQHAFEAASRVLKTADELYQTILNMV